MMFKMLIRSFCNDIKALDRNYVLNLLKQEKSKSKMTYAEIAKKLNKSEIYVAACFNGEHPVLDDKDFEEIYKTFLSNQSNKELFRNTLKKMPIRGQNCSLIKNDPTVYRLNEIVNIYGLSIKELIEEKAGNGIMSAIDLKIDVNVIDDDKKNKRIVITLNGKFLQYDC